MITFDTPRCNHCGICLKMHGGYCLNEIDGEIVIDHLICNQCQKCIVICPQMAFPWTGGNLTGLEIL